MANSAFVRLLNQIGAATPQPLHHALKALGLVPLLWLGYHRSQSLKSFSQGESARADSTNPLLAYFDGVHKGPGVLKWHHYFDIYDQHFRKFRGQDVNILEIGVYSGGSLRMWQEYFGPKCRVYGVDIDERCKRFESDSVKIFIGDQGSREFWARVRTEAPKIDIVVDDGGHQTHQQIVTFEEVLPHLQPGGVFLCEDLTFEFNGFISYMTGFVQKMNAFRLMRNTDDFERYQTSATTEIQSHVRGVSFYPLVTVIEKRERPLAELACQKHGTSWEW